MINSVKNASRAFYSKDFDFFITVTVVNTTCQERRAASMTPQDIRDTLITRTITVIADEGLDKTTTKAITQGTGINESYIYRRFSDKEDLLSKTFDKLDDELMTAVTRCLPIMYVQDIEFEQRCRAFFNNIWAFLLGNKEKCLAFVRYYYSPYFTKYSAESHKKRFLPIVESFSLAFIDEADVWMILNHILNVLLDFAVKVHNGQMPEEDDYSEHVFRVIYRSVEQYFKATA